MYNSAIKLYNSIATIVDNIEALSKYISHINLIYIAQVRLCRASSIRMVEKPRLGNFRGEHSAGHIAKSGDRESRTTTFNLRYLPPPSLYEKENRRTYLSTSFPKLSARELHGSILTVTRHLLFMSPVLYIVYNTSLLYSTISLRGGDMGFVDDYTAWVTG